MTDHDEQSTTENRGSQFARLPATANERVVEGRATRAQVLDWWETRFGIDPGTFGGHTFWEKGAGKIWAFAADTPTPIAIEGLGMKVLRTRQEHWKPTTNAVQRFGQQASQNVIALDSEQAARFVRGKDQEIEWDGDWGYLIAAHELADASEPIGVGLYVYGELRSQMPKGRQEELDPR